MGSVPGAILAADYCLNPIEQRLVNDWRVLPVILLATPDKVSVIEGIFQHFGNRASHHLIAFTGRKAPLSYMRLQTPDRILSIGVELKHLPDDRSPLLIELDGLVYCVVLVAQRCKGGKLSLFRLLQQPFSRLLGEVVDVVLCHQHLDAVNELLVRAGVLVQHRPFLDEDQRHIQVVDDHIVFEITVQPVGLLAEDGTYLRAFLLLILNCHLFCDLCPLCESFRLSVKRLCVS